MTRGQIAGVAAAGLILFAAAFGVGYAQTHGKSRPAPQRVSLSGPPASGVSATGEDISSTAVVTTTTVPCKLSSGSGASRSVPVNQVCSSAGAPHFDTPQAAMTYLAGAWNSNDVRQIDYVTSPAGRRQMDSMAAQMANLRFDHCTPNPAGDYTCYFQHDIAPSTSPTTYPNPGNYPPGEAVFTVAPAGGPGWYLTFVIHCG